MGVGKVSLNRIHVLSFLSLVAITCITLFKNALELEDAEQAYYSQWLRWGYDDQPPLYTWIQYGINEVFGISKISFSVVRGIIFFGILQTMYLVAKRMLGDTEKAKLAVLGLALVPVFIDFTFRRLSHTSLLCLSILSSYWIIQQLIVRKSLLNYLYFGIIISFGILSKYNYILFLGAFGFAAIFDGTLRRIVCNTYSIGTILVMIFLLAPHVHWLFALQDNFGELQKSIDFKTKSETEDDIFLLSTLFQVFTKALKLIGPLFTLLILFYFAKKIKFTTFKIDWFTRLFWAQSFFLLISFMCWNVQKIEARWLLPLFLPFLVLLVRYIHFKTIKSWTRLGFVVFLSIILLQVARTPFEKVLGIDSSVHHGFHPVLAKLSPSFGKKQWILPNVTYGGNIRVLYPGKTVFSKDDFSLPESSLYEIDAIEVLLKKESLEGRTALDSIIGFGKEKEDLYFVRW